MKALALNLVIAVIWLLLSSRRATADFFIGFGLGFVMLAVFNAVLPGAASYPRRCLALMRFGLIFAREFVSANLSVARIVLFQRKESLHPNFIRYDVSGLRPGEILLLSYCITLTPGTTAVHVSDDFRNLVIHALDTDALDTDALDTDALDTDALDTDALDTDALDTDALDTDALDTDALDTDAPDTIRRQIDERLKTPMLRFTR